MNWLEFAIKTIGLVLVVGVFAPLIIEAVKKLKTTENTQRLALLVGALLSVVVYLTYLLFFVIGKVECGTLDIVKLVVIGILFVFACSVGSQVGYDKIYKPLIELFKEGNNGSNNK